jgi:molecular chaperone GrpE
MCQNHEQESENINFETNHKFAPSEQELETKLAACMVAKQEWQEKYMRLTADLANFNRRIEKERAMWSDLARADLLTPLLTVIDNFDRAVQTEQVSPGVKMIHSAFVEFLKNAGVKEVAYDTFNPEIHEALVQVDVEGKEAGTIVEVMQKGYILGDKVLRPAQVSVTK